MIRGIFFLKPFRGFAEGDIVPFGDGVTILVGDQGCGKSTIIELVRAHASPSSIRQKHWRSITFSEEMARQTVRLSLAKACSLMALDLERDSFRDTSEMQEEPMAQIAALRSSHGEASLMHLRPLMTFVPKGPTTFLLDEPDAALSPRSVYELVRAFRRLAQEGHQVIVSAHNPILITGRIPGDDHPGWKVVWNVEEKTWVKCDVYLADQAKPRSP